VHARDRFGGGWRADPTASYSERDAKGMRGWFVRFVVRAHPVKWRPRRSAVWTVRPWWLRRTNAALALSREDSVAPA